MLGNQEVKSMAKSTIIKQLVNNEVSLTVVLRRIYVLANDIENDKAKEWAFLELNGYKSEDQLPDYRVFNSCELHYTGINGAYQVTNQPLSLTWLKPETVNDITQHRIIAPVSEIENNAAATDAYLVKDRSYLAGEVYEKSNDGFQGIQCFSIQQVVPTAQFARIINSITNIALNILLELDRVYGKLDDLDIGSGKISKKDKTDLFKNLNYIIVGKTVKVNHSNIGSGSNAVTKTTDIEVSPNVSVNADNKKNCWLSKIFKKRQ